MNASKKLTSLIILIAASILCYPAFNNGFPLLFPDTSGYLEMGFNNTILVGKVWLYGAFVRHVSLMETPWLIIFAQGVLISWLIYLMFKNFFSKKDLNLLFFGYILVAGTTTALSFHTSVIMPDIFTPMVILCFCLLLLAKELTKIEKVFVVLLFIFASGTHNSHLLINLGFLGLIVLGSLFKKNRMIYSTLGITARKVASLFGIVLAIHLLVCTIHYTIQGEFVATRGGGVFMFARLCDFNIAQDYLKENCDKNPCKICPFVDKLKGGRAFLWAKEGGLRKTGGWTKEAEKMYADLSYKMLTTPKYLKRYIIRSFESTVMLLYSFDFSMKEEIIVSKWGTSYIKNYFPAYSRDAYWAHQVRGTYDGNYSILNNFLQLIVLCISAILILILLTLPNYSLQQKAIVLFILSGLLLNAFVAASTSGVYARYQSRVVWLITLPAFGFLWNICVEKKVLKNV
jgi:hypothetical protein